MFQTALVASDLSGASDRLISSLDALHDFGVKHVSLVHALGLDRTVGSESELVGFIESRLEAQIGRIRKLGFETDLIIAHGSPFSEILSIDHERPVSLIVMGSHGAGLASEILLGSVTQRVLRRATLPVLVFRTDEAAALKSSMLKRVLFPTDFSDNAEKAFACLEKLVTSQTEKVILLHADDSPENICAERLELLRVRLSAVGVKDVGVHVEAEKPLTSILTHAVTDDCSLIVMGSQGRGFLPEIFIGSVSFNVVRKATIPVLLIPAHRDKQQNIIHDYF